MMLDKEALRADLLAAPGLIHLDNAGAGLMPRCVLDAQFGHLRLEAAQGGYEAARQRHDAIEAVYDSLARLLHCTRDEIAIVENATVGWRMAFYAIPFEPGDRILTAEAEYASNYLAYLQLARAKGIVVETVPSTPSGELCVDSLERMIDARVRLISVTHVPTNGGLVNPIEAIGKIARRRGILYLVDACQSAGQLALDVEAIQCDLLSATGRKYLRGPRGVGFLYVSRRVLERLHPPMIDLHSATWLEKDSYALRNDARRFENWECNYAARLGLGRAVDYALALGLDRIETEISRLAQSLRSRLGKIPGVRLHDIGQRRCGIVTFSIDGIGAECVESELRQRGINVSISTPAGTLIDASRRGLPDLVRASVHCYNEDAEVETVQLAITEIAQAAGAG